MQWIKHDTDANQDAKLQNVLLDYGLEGYGLYWYCIELIAGKVDKNNITFELEHDARIIARNTGSTTQKIEEMMKYFVSIGLFECANNTITCMKLAKRLDQSMTSNPQMREIIKNFKSHDAIMMKSDDVMQDKIRLEEKRKEKSKENKAPKVAVDFSVLQVGDSDLEEIKRIRRKNKGGSLTQRVVNALGKEFEKAANMGYTLDEVLTEWEVRAWKSFKADWMPKKQIQNGYSRVTQQNLNNLDGEW